MMTFEQLKSLFTPVQSAQYHAGYSMDFESIVRASVDECLKSRGLKQFHIDTCKAFEDAPQTEREIAGWLHLGEEVEDALDEYGARCTGLRMYKHGAGRNFALVDIRCYWTGATGACCGSCFTIAVEPAINNS